MKILVTGSRDWNTMEHWQCILSELEQFPEGTTLIHGNCEGVDKIAAAIAEELKFIIRAYPAEWKDFGTSAGPIRNRQMISCEHSEAEPIDLILAFHDNLEESKGTKDMVSLAKPSNIELKLVDGKTV